MHVGGCSSPRASSGNRCRHWPWAVGSQGRHRSGRRTQGGVDKDVRISGPSALPLALHSILPDGALRLRLLHPQPSAYALVWSVGSPDLHRSAFKGVTPPSGALSQTRKPVLGENPSRPPQCCCKCPEGLLPLGFASSISPFRHSGGDTSSFTPLRENPRAPGVRQGFGLTQLTLLGAQREG